jgi:hypothetical protein
MRRSSRILGGMLMAALATSWLIAQSAPRKRNVDPAARTVEATFSSTGNLRVVLECDRLEVASPYGALSIPVEDIRTIELATRLAPGVQQRVDDAIFNLGSEDFKVREEAQKELLALAEQAFPSLVTATKHADLEIAERAQELVAKLRGTLPEEHLEVREYDKITTQHSSLSGRLTAESLPVLTRQFGAQQLKLCDVRNIRSITVDPPEIDPMNVLDDPGSLTELRTQVGKTFAFRVTGRADGIVWGTGVYTTDSTLATAAVHAGALKAGESGVVRVTIIAPPPSFAGSTANGVSSSPYGPYPAAYQVVVRKAQK